ncbi:MAG: peptidoglycan-associated lipoprotein Pal [candidate division Zixibacteria bacterium]
MKKLLLICGLLIIMLAVYGCGSKPPPPPEEPPVAVVDTTPPPPPPPPPPPEIKESDFVVIYFDFDKYNIRGDQKANLDNNAEVMNEFADAVVKIEGHCDERGTVEYNLALGDKRGNSVREYLVGLGISADRIEIVSYGKERPAITGSNEEAWAKNRRAEFRIILK